MALRLDYLCYLMLFSTVILADVFSPESPYYEYCRVMDTGEKRQECRLLEGQEDVIFHSKYQAKRQVIAGSSVAVGNESGEGNSAALSELSTYVAASGRVASNQTGPAGSGGDQESPVSHVAANTTDAAANATVVATNTTSATANVASAKAANSSTAGVGIVSNATSTNRTSTSVTGVPIVASEVMVINDAEINNNSVQTGENADLYRRFRDMLNMKRPQQNDTLLLDSDHEFDDLFGRFNEIINNNNTLKQNNITKYEEDYHQYYNSSFIVSEEISQKYWVTMSERENVQVNEMLSSAHRRAVTVRLTFDFPFYGHLIRNVTVATGGFLFTGEYVHSWLAATQYVAPLMANFDTSLSNSSVIKYVDNGTSFTVEWENVILKDEPHYGEFTFQVTLHNSGDIVFVYKHVPVIIENIHDRQHPVKVGLSDAYISDRIIFFIRKKTIYEYHRVEFKKEDISNWTVIYLSALPTCVSKTSCYECFTEVPGFQCSWCPVVKRCSNGIDRQRKGWVNSGCDSSAYESVHMCPGIQERLGEALIAGATLTPQEVSMAKHYDSGRMPGILAIVFLVAIVGLFGLWMLYAYRNPHTPSGQFLIRYRPSQWRWRRGEARYTAATIHM